MARPQTLESAPAEAPLYPPHGLSLEATWERARPQKPAAPGAQRDCPESSKDSPEGQRVFSQSPCRELGLKASWSTAARSRCWQRPRALETSSRSTSELFANRSEAARGRSAEGLSAVVTRLATGRVGCRTASSTPCPSSSHLMYTASNGS